MRQRLVRIAYKRRFFYRRNTLQPATDEISRRKRRIGIRRGNVRAVYIPCNRNRLFDRKRANSRLQLRRGKPY